MSNRKLPFGYHLENGKINIQEQEAQLVECIFRWYCDGESLKTVTERLSHQAVPFAEGRCWNKNIVARILADERYLGTCGYPAIIESETFLKAAGARGQKAKAAVRTDNQRLLERLCHGTVSADLEHQVTDLLRRLAEQPERIQVPEKETEDSCKKLQAGVKAVLEQQPINEIQAEQAIYHLAEARYAAINDQEYETERLRHLIDGFKCTMKPSVELLRNILAEVVIEHGSVRLILKNGQSIGEDDLR